MVAGRVVRFDSTRGYGFIAPEHGGEDVFVHVNDLMIPESYVRTGLVVQFDIEEGERGLKASSVQLPAGADGKPVIPVTPTLMVPAAPAARPAAEGGDSLCDVLSTDEYLREVTEVLLEAAPTLTAAQILEVRRGLLKVGHNHGWAEG